MKKIAIIVVSVAVAAALGWLLWPTLVVGSLVFVEKKGEEPGRAACDRIVALGPRVIPAIISSLKRHSPWSRSSCYLPVALRELGAPAHEALLRAIASEPDALTRAKLISSLQNGFGDYSCLNLVIDDAVAGRTRGYPIHMIGSYLQADFTNAPEFHVGSGGIESINVNPEFVKWWKERGEPATAPYSEPAARSPQR